MGRARKVSEHGWKFKCDEKHIFEPAVLTFGSESVADLKERTKISGRRRPAPGLSINAVKKCNHKAGDSNSIRKRLV